MQKVVVGLLLTVGYAKWDIIGYTGKYEIPDINDPGSGFDPNLTET